LLKGILFAALTAFAWTGVAGCYRRAARNGVDLLVLGAVGPFLAAVWSLPFVRWNVLADGEDGIWPTVLLMAVAGPLNQLAMVLVGTAMKRGHSALSWAVSQMALVVPFLFAVVFWREERAPVQWFGLAALVAAVWIMSARQQQAQPSVSGRCRPWWTAAIASFLVMGLASVLLLVPSHAEGFSDPAGLRVPVSLGMRGLTFALLSLVLSRRITRECVKTAFVLSLFMTVGHRLFFAGADILAKEGLSGIVHPIAVGGCVLLFSIYCHLFLKERLSRKEWLGVAVGAAGMLLLALW